MQPHHQPDLIQGLCGASQGTGLKGGRHLKVRDRSCTSGDACELSPNLRDPELILPSAFVFETPSLCRSADGWGRPSKPFTIYPYLAKVTNILYCLGQNLNGLSYTPFNPCPVRVANNVDKLFTNVLSI